MAIIFSRMESLSPEQAQSTGNLDPSRAFSREAILQTVADRSRRKIMASTIEFAKTAEEISLETSILLSTCYRKITDLVESKILVVERTVMTKAGKKFAVYRSAIETIRVDIGPQHMAVSVKPNPAALDKVRSAWLSDMLDETRPNHQD